GVPPARGRPPAAARHAGRDRATDTRRGLRSGLRCVGSWMHGSACAGHAGSAVRSSIVDAAPAAAGAPDAAPSTAGGPPAGSILHRLAAALTYRDFRVLWLGACTSSIGTWMQKVAQSWLV